MQLGKISTPHGRPPTPGPTPEVPAVSRDRPDSQPMDTNAAPVHATTAGSVNRDWIADALRQYQGPLLKYAQRMLGDADKARDAVQETFLKLCRQQPEDVQHRLAEWLFTVCRHQLVDWARKEQRMSLFAEDPRQEAADNSTATDPAAPLERQEEAAKLAALLEQLPPRQREAIRLRFDHGFSYRQISEITGQSVSHVGVLLHEGIKTLRSHLMPMVASEQAT